MDQYLNYIEPLKCYRSSCNSASKNVIFDNKNICVIIKHSHVLTTQISRGNTNNLTCVLVQDFKTLQGAK